MQHKFVYDSTTVAIPVPTYDTITIRLLCNHSYHVDLKNEHLILYNSNLQYCWINVTLLKRMFTISIAEDLGVLKVTWHINFVLMALYCLKIGMELKLLFAWTNYIS